MSTARPNRRQPRAEQPAASRRRGRPKAPAEPTPAIEVAVRYLGTRPRTRWEVERRLRRAGIEEPEIAATVERLTELGYLDDAAFARWWGEQRDRHDPRGRRMIEAELRQRGVPRDVIEAFRGDHDEPERAPEDAGLPADEPQRAAEALARHLRGRPLPSEPKAVQRVGMYLMRRGFDADIVRSTIRAAAAGMDATDVPIEE
jgi:regulatory protein